MCQTTFRAPLKLAAGSGLGTRLCQTHLSRAAAIIAEVGLGTRLFANWKLTLLHIKLYCLYAIYNIIMDLEPLMHRIWDLSNEKIEHTSYNIHHLAVGLVSFHCKH